MCTLTVVPTSGPGYRLAFNRDERPGRAAATRPAVTHLGGRAVALPTDPESGGTWLAVSNSGLTLAVLNGNPGAKVAPGPVSRGRLIPAAVVAATPWGALNRAADTFVLPDLAPFRLVAVGGGVVADLRWDGRDAEFCSRPLAAGPVLFTSSGLGDALVTPPRTALFDELFAAPPMYWSAAQDAFHVHRWPGQEHVSVNMSRPTARTVSFAVIAVEPDRATFFYHPAAPHEPAADCVLELPLAAGVLA